MLPITGYLDRLSVTAGDRLEVKVSSQLSESYQADLVRIVHADPNPAGPGMRLEEIPHSVFAGTFPSRNQPIHQGSYARVAEPPALSATRPFSVSCLIWPTLPDDGPQVVMATRAGTGSGFAFGIGPDGAWFELDQTGSPTPLRIATGQPLTERRWYRVWASFNPQQGSMQVSQVPYTKTVDDGERVSALHSITTAAPQAPGPLLLAARPGTPVSQHYNGRLEDPVVLGSAASADIDLDLLDPRATAREVLAWWDFAVAIDTQGVVDRGPHGCGGQLVNLPTRAVCGARWDGSEMSWCHAPEQYAAIHFHDDDLGDCGWETDFAISIQEALAGGVYGVRLRCEDAEDILPFYVRPQTPTAPILLLISTFTYQAYFNHARGNADAAYFKRAADWGAYAHNPDQHPEYGRSTYNVHRDGSGVCYSSRRRPVLTMRPGFLTFNDAHGSGLRHFPADSHLTDWLEQQGFAFDVATDEDLDNQGIALLESYTVVLTGSHPEYHTPRMLDALTRYRDNGGRLVYLGGNGFYWRIARNPALPEVIEIRRAEGGIRAWAAEPGEYYNSLDGGYGGLWRRNGRYPQALCGIGFSAQGLFESSYYRRLAASRDERAAWIFAGIDDEILGDFGLNGGGAAGFELDRADVRLGTPRHALVLARSEHHTASFVVVPEELLTHRATLSGEPLEDLIRGEIVFFETANGGAVFSVGSITFCGSLSHGDYDNAISRMLTNVIRRFADPTPFALPLPATGHKA